MVFWLLLENMFIGDSPLQPHFTCIAIVPLPINSSLERIYCKYKESEGKWDKDRDIETKGEWVKDRNIYNLIETRPESFLSHIYPKGEFGKTRKQVEQKRNRNEVRDKMIGTV